MEVLAEILSAVACWGAIMFICPNSNYSLFGITVFPIVGFIASALYVVLPKIFSAGTADENGSKLGHVFVLLELLLIIVAMQFLHKSIVTVGITSFYLGATFTYLGKLISKLLSKKTKVLGITK